MPGPLETGISLLLCMEQALVLYTASGGSKRDDFKSNPIAEIRDSLDFLLYDTVQLEGRFQECADGAGAFKLRAVLEANE